ncbi:MAG: histidine ammonia-lyase [Balneolales bacterium]|nr:histidine ammonia-lyase [Balneolales bacterium]
MHSIRLAHLYADLRDRLASLGTDTEALQRSRAVVEAALRDGRAYYGINTGFGGLASRRISEGDLTQLQQNLLLSHAVGVGEPVPKAITRLMLQLKLHALGQGYSGVSRETFALLLRFAELDLIPVVPSKGSLGASGDLAPLAHLALPLIGYGHFWDDAGERQLPAGAVLQKHGLEPVQLQAKDGLSLINGTQMMQAYGAYVLEKSIALLKTADLLATTSLEALQGSIAPFDDRIQQVRRHPGQAVVAGNVRMLLRDSEILESHRNCGKVQDPYSLRCVPQVHGASRGALAHCMQVMETELNSVNDNPLVFGNGDIISGGNFHGQPIALAMDYAAIALAELGSIAERRTYLLLEGHDGLPTLLMQHTGINSGFMIPQYTSASLVSENKVFCHPASVDSIPSSLGQEDHVSMGSISATKLLRVFENVEHILSIELLTAIQALDFRRPLRPGLGVEIFHHFVRDHIPHAEQDTYFKEYMEKSLALIREGAYLDLIGEELGELG